MPTHTSSKKQDPAATKTSASQPPVHQSRTQLVPDYRTALNGTVSPQEVVQLQRTIGNQAVQRLIQSRTAPAPSAVIQRVYDPDEKVNSEPHLTKIRLALIEEFTDPTFVDDFIARHPLIGEIKGGKEVPLGRIVFTARTVKQKQDILAAHSETPVSSDLIARLKVELQKRLNRDSPSTHERDEFTRTNASNTDALDKGNEALTQFGTLEDSKIDPFLNELFAKDKGAQALATKSLPILVNYCYGRWQKFLQKGESYFIDDSEKGPHEGKLRGHTMTEDVPDIALGYTWVPDFHPDQLEAMRVGTELGASNIPTSVASKVQNPTLSKLGTDHHLQDFVKGLEETDISKHPVYFHQWVEWGLATKFDVYDNWKPWQRAFDSAVEGVLKLGGKIYFNLKGFPKFEIDEVRKSKFYLPWHNAKDPTKSFSAEHSRKGMVPGTSLGIGLRITHWEIAQVMHNRNMWDNTVFMFYDKSTKTPTLATSTELSDLGIEFLGDSPDLNPI